MGGEFFLHPSVNSDFLLLSKQSAGHTFDANGSRGFQGPWEKRSFATHSKHLTHKAACSKSPDMAFKTYQLYGAAAASASNVSSVTIRRDCDLVGIHYRLTLDQVADNSSGLAAVSVNPTSQIGVNDAMGSIIEVGNFLNLVTSGIGMGGLCGFSMLPPLPLRTNDTIYLHMLIVTSTLYFNGIIYVREK